MGFKWDDELQMPLPMWYGVILAPPVAYRSDLLSESAKKYSGLYTGEYSLGGLYCAWHDEDVLKCMPWQELEIVGFKHVEIDGDIMPRPVPATDLDWMALST